jgi:hypothetical protein
MGSPEEKFHTEIAKITKRVHEYVTSEPILECALRE